MSTMNNPPEKSDSQSTGDDQLLDAMLRGHLQDSPAAKNDRIDRVMAAIDRNPEREPADTRPAFTPWRHRPFGRALAAGFLLATITGLALIVARPRPADATVLQRSIERLADGDLTYIVSVSNPRDDLVQKERGRNRDRADTRRIIPRNPSIKHPGRRTLEWRLRPEGSERVFPARNLKRLDGAILHTQGNRSVLLVDVREDQVLARGFDGSRNWSNFKDPESSRAKRENGQGEPRFNPSKRYLRFITHDLASQLEEIERRYDLSGPVLVEDVDGGPPLIRHEAVRRSKSQGGAGSRGGAMNPGRIELWTDPDTERIVLCRFDFHSDPEEREVTSIEFRLESTMDLPDGVFDPDTYPTFTPRRRSAEPRSSR